MGPGTPPHAQYVQVFGGQQEEEPILFCFVLFTLFSSDWSEQTPTPALWPGHNPPLPVPERELRTQN